MDTPRPKTGENNPKGLVRVKERGKRLHFKKAHERFMEHPRSLDGLEKSFKAGISLKKFEIERLKEGKEAKIYVKENDIISCQITDGMKIKSPLILPGVMATYLRLIIDSHFIPFNGKLIKENESFRVQISIG